MPHVRSILIIIGIACCTLSAFSQPELTIESVTVNWPTIYVDFRQYCNGEPSYHGEKSDYSVFEDGMPVKEFTLSMSNPHGRNEFSVSLVFDASASMQGDHRDWTKSAAHNFINNMDGVGDEAAIVWFHSSVNVELSLTSNKMSLHNAVDALPAAGATAMWNGAYEGIQQIVSGASNNVRAVIVLSDGADNSSNRTVQELVALANQHRVKVYTIGLGTGADLPSLDALASNTGGVFFHCTTVSELHSAYMDIFDRLISTDISTITYQSNCTDGRERVIEVVHNDLCGGDANDAWSYHAPFDTTGFSSIDIAVLGDTLPPGTSTTIPVTAQSAGAPVESGLIFEISYNKEIANIYSVQLDGTLLENISPVIQLEPGLISVTIEDYLWIQGLDTLLKLRLQADISPPPPGETMISFDEVYSSSCNITSYNGGLFVVNNLSAPGIVVHGATEFCDGDSVTLEVSDGFTDYRWSTGDTAKSITVYSSQNVWVEARNSSGQLRVSSSVPITVYPIPQVSIAQPDTVIACNGDSVALSAEGDFSEYLWSTGEGSKSIKVDQSGEYVLQARSANGCWGESSPVRVVFHPAPAPSIVVTGDVAICYGDTTYLDAGAGYDEYVWSTGEQTRQISVTAGAEYWVVVRRFGCEGVSDTVVITTYPKPEKPQIVRTGDTLQCTIDGAAFQWFIDGIEIPGEISQTTVIQDHGRYTVRVVDANGCTSLSDPMVVTSVDGIPEALAFDVSISPNPGPGTFLLRVQSGSVQTYSVIIHDASVKTVHNLQLSDNSVSQTATIQLGDVPEGVYFLSVSSPTSQQTKKLIVLRK